ncbi:MAG: transcriptional repressor [Actinomycetes bacterium]|nr:transcriptional repressor [Actinomycetes bacterium]
MTRANRYHTRQGEAILAYLSGVADTYLTPENIAAHFAKRGISVGLTTIYRHLDKLEKSGRVRKLVIDGIPSACYRYVSEPQNDSLHMKCDGCGKLYNLECNEADEFEQHVFSSHNFRINPMKTVFYGMCEDCHEKP